MLEHLSQEESLRILADAEEKQRRDEHARVQGSLQQGLEQGIEQGLELGRQEGRAEGEKLGLAKGRQKGRQEGFVKGRFEVAKNMLLDREPLSKICKFTGLSKTELKKIKL